MSSFLVPGAAHEGFNQTIQALIKANTRHSHISCFAKQHRSWERAHLQMGARGSGISAPFNVTT